MKLDLIKEYSNKYNLTPKSIKKLKILDWDKLKKKTWKNDAMTNGTWFCHLEGCQYPGSKKFDDEDEFWIGFREDDNKIDCHFTSYDGLCGYNITEFYDKNQIDNSMDLNVQINAICWLNQMIDEKILSIS